MTRTSWARSSVRWPSPVSGARQDRGGVGRVGGDTGWGGGDGTEPGRQDGRQDRVGRHRESRREMVWGEVRRDGTRRSGAGYDRAR